MENTTHLREVSEEIIQKDSEFKNDELLAQREKTKHQKTLFFSVVGSSALLMVVAISSAVYKLYTGSISTQEVAVLTFMITAPIILVLALMRYVYDGRKTDTPAPTLMLNVGKEFASVLTSIFKK